MPLSSPGPLTAPSGPDFGYSFVDGLFDETTYPSGEFRSHWRPFFEQIEALGLSEVRRRWDEAKHLIRENGVTYNVYGDPQGMDRPWELDPVPLLIATEDAAALEAGLVQRARVLDLLLADLYGPQTVLKTGLLPAELVFGHPGYLRACHGLILAGGRHLHLYAADVGRSPDGRFHILRDRTQAPSGSGYALENRMVLSRMLPDVFRDCRVHRLASFFQTLRESLAAIAPLNRDDPRVVLLTPGPYNETYFEHAFLARYLGYTLVEGADLTVRDNRVYLKLLGGLQPVDVILRRLDDDYCDPLELRGDSFLGVPGLVQAVRAGNVAVANALGSGLIESPAIPAFLPAICRHFLGEELRLNSVPSWWCGDPASMSHVLAHLHRMVIKPAFPQGRTISIFCENLSATQLQAVADRIQARPGGYIAQELLPLSTAPILGGEQFEPRRLLLRCHLAADQVSYTMMPGGLTRIAPSRTTVDVSMQKGGGSKDTWFLSSGPVSQFSLLPTTVKPVELRRDGGDLPSRAADDLFWLGRYTERTEGFVRLVRAILVRLCEKTGLVDVPDLPVLLRALTEQTLTLPGFVGLGAEERIANPAEELISLIFSEERGGSLASTIDFLHRVAGRVRDRLSSDMWRIIMSLDLQKDLPRPSRFQMQAHAGLVQSQGRGFAPREASSRRALAETLDLMDRKVIGLASFGGMVAESMTRGQGWRFLDMGRRIERGLHVVGLIRSTLVTVPATEGSLLESLLEIADSLMTYRRRYLSHVQTAPVLDLLLFDHDNPRSLAFQLNALSASIDALPRSIDQASGFAERQIIAQLIETIGETDVERIAQLDENHHRELLRQFLHRIESELPRLSDALTSTYLTHLQAARQYALSPFGPAGED